MGNTKLVAELAAAKESVTQASSSLASALAAFSDVAQKVEDRIAELEALEGRCEEKERKVAGRMEELGERMKEWGEAEERMGRESKDWEEKRRWWEEAEGRMTANAAKIKEQVVLNVDGIRFYTTKATLLKQKGSLFEEMVLTSHSQQSENGEFFIDHDAKYFKMVLNYLRDGKLRNDELETANMKDLMDEFQYYKIHYHQQHAKNDSQEKKQEALKTTVAEKKEPQQQLAVQQKLFGGDLLSPVHQQKIAEWIPGKRFELVYKATRDGFASADFHRICDVKSPTLHIIKTKEGFLFGGFTSETWAGTNINKSDPTAFVFTLHNPHSIPPTRYSQQPGIKEVIRCNTERCTYFRGGFCVSSESNQNINSSTSFILAPFDEFIKDTTGKGNKIFTGTNKFTTNEIEVYVVL